MEVLNLFQFTSQAAEAGQPLKGGLVYMFKPKFFYQQTVIYMNLNLF